MRAITELRSGADLVLVNSPLRDYDIRPRLNEFTLPTLGLGYIATCAEHVGFDVDLVDVEALGMGLTQAAALVNARSPRWVGLNLLAPTYVNSVSLLRKLDPSIRVMLGGHQAKAMPEAILRDSRIPRIDALVLGESETRVPLLLADDAAREQLPKVYWRQGAEAVMPHVTSRDATLLAPDVDAIPLLDRKFLPQDPYDDHGTREAAMVASRGCPFDCSFCGAAVSANPDVTIRMRTPSGILAETGQLASNYGVQRIRFVDDLFLANRKVIRETLGAFVSDGSTLQWDATGRINILANADNDLIDLMRRSGCREVALGIESGSDRVLAHIDKKITVAQVMTAVTRLCAAGINIKGYFILGLPTETQAEQQETLRLIRHLWKVTANLEGRFRCSAFEYRPYPGTPDWKRLVAAGFSEEAMLDYSSDDTEVFDALVSPDRDEFNFSTGLQFGETPVAEVRRNLAAIMREQHLQ
jgi:radical SAM superfamily enzyme YgiQ (UPF0313 family)